MNLTVFKLMSDLRSGLLLCTGGQIVGIKFVEYIELDVFFDPSHSA